MGFRMYCADCGATDFPATRLDGSDTVESLGWLLGGLPGWLYCAWRHSLRTKWCGHCGSGSLVRESRAARARAAWPVPPRFPAERVGAPAALVVWSGPLHDPRRRLVAGVPWIAVWLLAALGLGTASAAVALAAIVIQGLCAAAWENGEAWKDNHALTRGSPRSPGPGHCHAWDDTGRPLRIELFACLEPSPGALPRLSWKAINTEPLS